MTWKVETVVLPIDFSGESEAAIRTALEIAESPSSVHCIHVLLPLDDVSPGVVLGDVNDKTREQAATDYMTSFVEKAGAAGVARHILFGDPGNEVADFAQRIAADLIVIPSHGYHGMKRFVLGSVAERVIRHAHCPVLVLRRSDAE